MSKDLRDFQYNHKEFRGEKNEHTYSFERNEDKSEETNSLLKILITIILVIMNVLNSIAVDSKRQMEQIQKTAQQNIANAQQEVTQAAQPHYEQHIVKAKSARECQVNGVITNASIKCMKNHYETVLVSGNQ
jgi:ElaB/YqjD/DUF883 family membrane-anchored ribosome-binding protein